MTALLRAPAAHEQPRPARRSRRSVSVGRAVAVAALLLAALMGAHALVPDVAGLGLLLDSIVPWLGLLVIPLAVIALGWARGRAWVLVLVPALVWGILFGGNVVPLDAAAVPPGAPTLTVASQNVEEGSGTAADSARTLDAAGADVIALQELTSAARSEVDSALAIDYAYSYAVGTVGLWSKYPIVHQQPLDLGLGWKRAIAADLDTPHGLVSIYVIHAASARPWDHSERDTMLASLSETLPRDENGRVLVVGDFNAASTDRDFMPLLDWMSEPHQTGGLLGFTWPATLPVTRLDHVLQRGLTVTENRTLPAGDSDHLAVLATVEL